MTQPLYFDYAATTPVDPRVARAITPYFAAKFGNPGSLHSFGQEAIAAVDAARETIARSLGADFREIVFTGSATEANNLALRGAVGAWRKQSGISEAPAGSGAPGAAGGGSSSGVPRIIISAIEHESVRGTARALAEEGAEVVEIGVGKTGVVDMKALNAALTAGTVLVSVMYANNEIGAVQPVLAIARAIAEFRRASRAPYPLFHTDAAQAFQFLPCRPAEIGADLLTLSAHKIYGPKGVGALYVRKGIRLEPRVTGGGQEFGLRSGTENVPLIAGFGKAVVLAEEVREQEAARVRSLAEYFWKRIARIAPRAALNGVPITGSAAVNGAKENATHIARLPNIINIYFPGALATDLVMQADLNGLAVASGSACASRSHMPSYVIRALGHGDKRAMQSVRISMGRPTTKADVDTALRILRRLLQSPKK